MDLFAGVFVALFLHEVQVKEQASLVSEDVYLGVQTFQDGNFIAAVAGDDEVFQEVVEDVDHALAKAKFMLFGKAVENGEIPFDKVVGFLNNRQFIHGRKLVNLGVLGVFVVKNMNH